MPPEPEGFEDQHFISKVTELWLEYYRDCESYDRIVCSSRNKNGIAIPVTSQEFILVNRNARSRSVQLLQEAHAEGFGDKEIQFGKREAQHIWRKEVQQYAGKAIRRLGGNAT